MKKITILLSALLLAHWGNAQDCTPGDSYSQDFETATVPDMPDCTSIFNAGTGNNWVVSNNPGFGFENNTLEYSSNGNPADAWFFTKGVQINAGTYYIVSLKYGNSGAATTEGLTITLGDAPDVASATIPFLDFDAVTGGTPQTPLIQFFNLPDSGVYYFGFHANSAASQGKLFVDDFSIVPMVCGTPIDVAVSNITQTGATLSWGAPNGGNMDIISVYQYAVMESNEPPADGTYNPPLSVDVVLEPGTTYYAFTRTLCGPVWSDWTEPVIFTTPACAPVAIPYMEDFEDAVLPGIPDCTLAANEGLGNIWATVNNPGSGFTSQALQYTANAETANAWFFTQGIELQAGTNYKFSYTYGNNSTESSESLRTYMLQNPNASWADGATPLTDHADISAGTATEFTFGSPISITVTGTYYFAFNAYSEGDAGNLYVDDIAVEEWTCGIPQNLDVTDIGITSATISWTAPSENTTMLYLYGYSTTDEIPTEIESTTDLMVTLADLEPNTTYYFYVQSLCGPLMGEWVSIPFTTEEDTNGLTDNQFSGFRYYPNPVSSILKLSNTSDIDSVEMYNLTGQLVFQKNINSPEAQINVSQLTTGVYFLTVHSGNESKKIKVIKQ